MMPKTNFGSYTINSLGLKWGSLNNSLTLKVKMTIKVRSGVDHFLTLLITYFACIAPQLHIMHS